MSFSVRLYAIMMHFLPLGLVEFLQLLGLALQPFGDVGYLLTCLVVLDSNLKLDSVYCDAHNKNTFAFIAQRYC